MSDKINVDLSAFIDGELENSDALLKQLAEDNKLKQSWSRYHRIRDVISGHDGLSQIDISASVREALEDEPAILAPVHKHKRKPGRAKFIAKQAAGLAIAASVSAVAVISVQQTQVADQPVAQTVASTPLAAPQSTAQTAQVRFVTDSKPLDRAVQSKLSNYIVNHNEYSVSSNMKGVLPYTRIVSDTKGERVIVRSADDK